MWFVYGVHDHSTSCQHHQDGQQWSDNGGCLRHAKGRCCCKSAADGGHAVAVSGLDWLFGCSCSMPYPGSTVVSCLCTSPRGSGSMFAGYRFNYRLYIDCHVPVLDYVGALHAVFGCLHNPGFINLAHSSPQLLIVCLYGRQAGRQQQRCVHSCCQLAVSPGRQVQLELFPCVVIPRSVATKYLSHMQVPQSSTWRHHPCGS